MSGGGRKGSALVVTMLILVILTAAGLYAVGLSTSGIESVSAAEQEQSAIYAAEAGLFYGIDRFPFLARERGIRLPNGAGYDVTVSHTGTVPIPGYDMGWAQALFRVRAVGTPPHTAKIRKTAEAEAAFGPVPSGTEPVERDDVPYGNAGLLVGPPSPYPFDSRDPSARDAFVQRHDRRKRILLAGTGNGTLRVADAGSSNPAAAGTAYSGPAEPEGEEPAVADIRMSHAAGRGGDSADSGWRTIAVAGAGGEEGGYFAFDITDPGSVGYPALLWEVTKRRVPILGRSRSTPAIGKVRIPAGRLGAPGATIDRWVILVGAEKGILVLEAETGRILQLLSLPGMGEVAASPAIAVDRDGYIDRAYVGDLSGNLWRVVAGATGRFDLGTGPFFSVTREDVAKAISGKCAVVPVEGTVPGLGIYFGTGDLETLPAGRPGGIFAVYDGMPDEGKGRQPDRTLTERDLADATRFFARIRDPEPVFPALGGTSFAGWFAILPIRGERILSGPRVFFSNLFLTTYRPVRTGSGEEGTAQVYGFGIAPGKNMGDGALFGPDGSGSETDPPGNPPVRVRTFGVVGIPSAPRISYGNGTGARLSVRSNAGSLEVFRVPAPRRMKSVRYWNTSKP
jgi:PilX N-terminal